jgi:hypothetical protein
VTAKKESGKTVTTLQYNFYKVQDYMQESMMSYTKNNVPVYRFSFIYEPSSQKKGAALSFHLTEREKKDIALSVYNQKNRNTLSRLIQLQKQN